MDPKQLLQMIRIIIIGLLCTGGKGMPKLNSRVRVRHPMITSQIGALPFGGEHSYPKTVEQIDYLMFVLQFTGSDIPNLFQLYKNETLGMSFLDKLKAAISVFPKIRYENIDDVRLLEIVRINMALKEAHCRTTRKLKIVRTFQNGTQTTSEFTPKPDSGEMYL